MPGDIPAPPMTNGQASESGFKLGDFSIDEHKPIKVVCIGAGFSGIIAGIRFPQRIPNVELTIYDKNAGVGGTWFTNKYPGLACDIPAHCYQLTFEPKTDWSAFYAPGPEIRSYLQSVVDKYKLMRYIKLQHRVVHARWGVDEEGAYEEFEDTADLLFTGVGSLSRWKWPVIDGLKDFKGKLFHTADFEVGDGEQAWQEAVHDWKDKRVGVIGVVDFQPTHIKHVTANGIELVDGTHEELDVLICATGYDYSFQLDFPIVGRGGATIQDKWAPHPSTYLARRGQRVAAGADRAPGGLCGRAARKMQRERLKSVEVKKEAVADFDEYLEHYFPNTVYSEKCRSWYKMGKEEGRVVALWPGSCLHAVRALEHPRWEDFQYELPDGVKNRMHWLGDGQTYNEKTMTGDRAWYLNDDQVDFPPVPADELVQ
ncbi:hypothetical protein EVJ58_g6594 [Rhodofomes roseus]|uniref:Cation diffusion facilitator CzcD-associated flavoprotein CzcO n=1 Tax=Rhodofomes roseus TaxID=34475 RepID=A0A4Y9Y7I6_9APHY|nr:hypothetical protein EVJ58_g6594 [Rhodofomes roseus]